MRYAKENQIQWREDASNAKTDYLRNALRHKVIPGWKAMDKHFDEQFRATLAHLGKAQEALEFVLEQFKTKHFIKEKEHTKIAVEALNTLKPADYFLHALFAPYGFDHVDDLNQLLVAQSGKQLISQTHRLIKDRSCWLLTPMRETPDEVYSIDEKVKAIDVPIALSFGLNTEVETVDKNVACFNKKLLKFPLTLRRWKQSDYFYPNGLKGKKKLSKYFKDEKLSLLEKETQWLLCSGDDIVWVVGRRSDGRFSAQEATEDKWLIRYHA